MNGPTINPTSDVFYDLSEDNFLMDPTSGELLYKDRDGETHSYPEGLELLKGLSERFLRMASVYETKGEL